MAAAKRMTKAQVYTELAEKTGLSKRDIQNVFTEMFDLIKCELGADGPGEFIVPDMLKLKVKEVPAREEHKGIDPFTKEERIFPAKPAARRVRATPLKKLKDLIA